MTSAWPVPPSWTVEQPSSAGRWEGRPWHAGAVRVVVLVVPLLAAVVAAIVASRLLPHPDGVVPTMLWWLVTIAASTVALVLVERQARRLLPLETLYKLTLLFPDRAPSRFRVALRAGTVRNLEERLAQGRHEGVGDDPSRAAANILVLAAALSRHDRRTRGHSERVRGFTDLIAEELHLPAHERDRLRWAALLHDIGKVRVHPQILNKSGTLSSQEWSVIHRHPADGARMAAALRPWLGPWIGAIEQHHERWDGRGYPQGLSGEEITISARIVAVADAFEVMTAPRSYRRPLGPAAARDELASCAGSHFDPAVVRAFLNISIGRLRWVMAPVAWLADLPFVRPVAQTGPVAEGALAGVAAKTFAAVSLAVFGVAAADLPPAATATEGGTSESQPAKGPQPPGAAPVVPLGSSAPGTEPPPSLSPPAQSPGANPAASTGAGQGGTDAAGAPSSQSRRRGRGAPPRAQDPPPVLSDDSGTVFAGKSTRIDVLANDPDRDRLDPKSLKVKTEPKEGEAEVVGNGRYIRYEADDDYLGTETFQYEVCDEKGACSIAKVTITILP